MTGWFPRYSPDGLRVTSERAGYWQAQWLDDVTEIAQDGHVLIIGGQPTDIPAPNELSAGGGRWAAWRPDLGVYTSWGERHLRAGCPTVSPEGEFFYVDDRQADIKTLIHSGFRIATGAIVDVRASKTALVWTMNGRTWGRRATGLASEIQAAPTEFRPVPIDTPDGPWVLNHTQTGLVLRPFGETRGYRFGNGGQTFYPDGVYRDGAIFVIFTNAAGVQTELPFPLGVARIDLTVAAPPTVPAIGRSLWCGWFEFGAVFGVPANCSLVVDADMLVRDRAGRVVAQYVASEGLGPELDMASLEADIAAAKVKRPGVPTLCYWTRVGQTIRVPVGAEHVGVEAYRRAGESLDALERRVRAGIGRVGSAWLIAQCYTSNPANDPDLAALVPVYARIMRDCPNVLGALVFSAGSRATGWDAHPEVHSLWRELFAGVTGVPSVPAPQPTPFPVPPKPKPPVPVPVPVPPQRPATRFPAARVWRSR